MNCNSNVSKNTKCRCSTKKSSSGGAGANRLIFTNAADNAGPVGRYLPGSGVSTSNVNPSVRAALRRRAAVQYDPKTQRSYNPVCTSKRSYFPKNENTNAPQNQIR